MVFCGTKNGSSMASLEETFEAPLFLRVYLALITLFSKTLTPECTGETIITNI